MVVPNFVRGWNQPSESLHNDTQNNIFLIHNHNNVFQKKIHLHPPTFYKLCRCSFCLLKNVINVTLDVFYSSLCMWAHHMPHMKSYESICDFLKGKKVLTELRIQKMEGSWFLVCMFSVWTSIYCFTWVKRNSLWLLYWVYEGILSSLPLSFSLSFPPTHPIEKPLLSTRLCTVSTHSLCPSELALLGLNRHAALHDLQWGQWEKENRTVKVIMSAGKKKACWPV